MRAWIYSVFVTLALISASVAAEADEHRVFGFCLMLADTQKVMKILERRDNGAYLRFMLDPRNSCVDVRLHGHRYLRVQLTERMYRHRHPDGRVVWDVWAFRDIRGDRGYTWIRSRAAPDAPV